MNFRKNLMRAALGVALTLTAAVSIGGSASNFWVNKTIDSTLRAQTAYTPATVYVALATGSASSTSCPSEVTTGTYQNYARVAVTSSLANWAGTQGAGTILVSSGTSGTTSNNNAITFPAPGAGGSATVVVAVCVFDSATSGGSNNLIFQTNLTTSKTINPSDAQPAFSPAALSWTIN